VGEVVGFVAMSHSPLWRPAEALDEGAIGSTFVNGVRRAQGLAARAMADAVVVFGPDHFRMFFYRCMPRFCVGIDELKSLGDYGGYQGPLPSPSALGREIFDAICQAGIDPALSLEMDLDHGISQVYGALFPDHTMPIVPVMVNTSAPPLATLDRCRALGVAVGEAVRQSASPARVFIVGSGGLSHSPPTPSLNGPDGDQWRSFLVSGVSSDDTENRRVEMAKRLVADGITTINPEWDRHVMAAICAGDLDSVCSLPDDEITLRGGSGGGEIRTWVAAAAAWGGPSEVLGYEPVERWITGMGCIGAFGSP
jgi:2,3-dihydroxyphenylpropionate 1,2-dioxygenase